MKYLSTFTGIGGFEIGIHRVFDEDAECIGYSEVDQPAIKTYEEHYEHHNYGDITAIDAAGLPGFDLFVGGFPCQAFSVAGKRRGFDEARGTLFFDVARILADKRPGHLVLENVKGLVSHDGGKTLQVILGVLADLGYRVEYMVLNSKDFGVPQNRERIYIVGHLRDGCGGQIFPLSGKDSFTPLVGIGTINRGVFKDTGGRALTIDKSYHKGPDNHGQRPVVKQVNPGVYQDGRIYDDSGISPTINPAAAAGGAVIPKIITGQPKYGEGEKRSVEYTISDEAPTIRATHYKNGDNQPRVVVRAMTETRTEEAKAIRRASQKQGRDFSPRRGKVLVPRKDEIGNTVTANLSKEHFVTDSVRIRRLTPVECERLQGFPDNWTVGSDTQRYKQCGNAVTTNVVEAVMSALLDEGCLTP